MSRSTRGVILAALLAVASALPAAAQRGPGLPSRNFRQNELFTVLSTVGSGSHGRAMMHKGYLGTLRSGTGLSFWDLSNPYAPTLVRSITGMGLSEPHTYAFTSGEEGQHLVLMRGSGLGGRGFGIWEVSDIRSTETLVLHDIPGVPGGYATGLFWICVQAPYVYAPAGSLGLYILDITDPRRPQQRAHIAKSSLGGFNTVLAFAVGNTLVLTNSDGGPGFALLDISDPVAPVLLHSNPTTPIPYGAQVNGGQLIVAAVSSCVSCPGGNSGSFHLHDIATGSFPSMGSVGLPSRGGSAEVQDQFAHIAASRSYLKLDLSQSGWPLVGRTDNPRSGGDYDWVTPLGNLVALGDDQGGATSLVPHQMAPDTIGPSVNMVVPANGSIQRAPTSRIGITLSDRIDTDSIDASTFAVRPVGGIALPGTYTNQLGIVNFTPRVDLAPNTTYEVVLPAGGIRDWAGNGIPATFSSAFSTGSTVNNIRITARPSPPTQVGRSVAFDVSSASGPGALSFSWSFGDGTPATPYSTSSRASHTYTSAGHYSAQVSVRSGASRGADAFVQTIHHSLSAARPTRSSTIALDTNETQIWCVNADNDTVTAIDAVTVQTVLEVPVGAHPRTLAFARDGSLWVVCEGDASVHVLDGRSGRRLNTLALPPGSAPYGIAMSPDGAYAFVTLRATGELARLDPLARTLVDTIAVGPEPKGLAITADSRRVLVSRFLSAPTQPGTAPVAEIYDVSVSPFARSGSSTLALDPGPDTENSGRGLPNYLSSLTISPDGLRAWIPSKKDNIERGLFRGSQALNFESTVRTIASQIDLSTGTEDILSRIDFNDREMAFAIEFSPLGDYAFVALQGSNAVDVRDAYSGDLVAGTENIGLAPQGLVMTSDGQRLFVHNFLSRTVSAYDIGGITASTSFAFATIGSASTVRQERLPLQVLRGKQIFYDATDPRMNEDGYLSCASCHLDGGQDGRTWDFTARGEGLRNTASLIGRSGMKHGRVHWTANFDEIQDFENDIRNAFGGDGFLSATQWSSGTVADPLGQPKAGLSAELDALAAYVASLDSYGRSPYRKSDGSLTPAAERGQEMFSRLGCASCHSGPSFTDSAYGRIHDVGTIRAGSGQALGGPLRGFDTPTLRGLWATAPYLHDGSATTLMAVLETRNPQGRHGATHTLSATEKRDLVAYLLTIDDHDNACRSAGSAEDLELSSGVDAAPNAACLEEAAGGQVLSLALSSPGGVFHGELAVLLYQVHTPGNPPLAVLPGLHLDRIDHVQLTSFLPSSGFESTIPIPPLLGGFILRVQGVVLSALARNGSHATSDAHDVFLR